MSRFPMNQAQARKLVEQCFPNVRIRQSRQILGGWENFVLEVNGDIVFRFPINKDTEQRLRTEIELLSRIRRLLSVRVPEYEYVWRGDKDRPFWFGGYRKISGVPLRARSWGMAVNSLAREISRFVKQLHAISLGNDRPRNLPAYSPRTWARRQKLQYDKIRKIVYPILSPRLRESSRIFWKNLLDDLAESHFKPTLIHADLGFANILVSRSTGRLSGILDWGYAQIGDPALDFSHLIIDRPRLGNEIVRLYGSEDPEFYKRVELYVKSEAYYDIMWGIENHWDKAVDKGMKSLRKPFDVSP